MVPCDKYVLHELTPSKSMQVGSKPNVSLAATDVSRKLGAWSVSVGLGLTLNRVNH